MAYYGPARNARQYFIDLGYEPANRQTTPDFLVSVTDPNARIPRQIKSPLPRTAADFASSFANSSLGRENKKSITAARDDLRLRKNGLEAYESSARAEHTKMARDSSPYIQSLSAQAKEVVIRRVQIFKGSLFVTITNLVAFAFQGIIIGTVYLKAPPTTAAYFSRSGVIFFALLFAALMAMSEIPALFSQRPIVLRHRQWAFYHPFIEAVALTLVDIPVSFSTSLVFGGLIYALVGLQKSAGQFFIFFLFVFFIAVVMRAYFRGLAAACKSEGLIAFLFAIKNTHRLFPQPLRKLLRESRSWQCLCTQVTRFLKIPWSGPYDGSLISILSDMVSRL
jgi:ATP-binding cassette subfamily G (WHITE) protein 2 (SNQ2)